MDSIFGGRPVGQSNPFTDAHLNSDVDSELAAQHHTLGFRANQAAPGVDVKKLMEQVTLLQSQVAILGRMDTGIPTAGAKFTITGSHVRRRGYMAVVNITATCNVAAVSGDTIMTLPAGFFPTTGATFFGELVETVVATSGNYRINLNNSGAITTVLSVAAGIILRGQLPITLDA